MDKINVIKILKNGFPEKHGWPEEHYKEIAAEIRASQWVSVEDENNHPDWYKVVLGWFPLINEVVKCRKVEDGRGGYYWCAYDSSLGQIGITHWQPTPEPPNKD